jgi:uncharacterized repeat protein (TIGR01451 family)
MTDKYQEHGVFNSIPYAINARKNLAESIGLKCVARKVLLLILIIASAISIASAALNSDIVAPTSIDNCAKGMFTLTLTNTGSGQATNLVASITIPTGFSYKTGTGSIIFTPNGGSPVGPTPTEPTTVTLPILTWNLVQNLNSGDKLQLNFHLVPSCGAQNGQNVLYKVDYKIGSVSQPQVSGSTQSTITVNKGLLKVTKLTADTETQPGVSVIEKGVGDTVDWVIRIANLGTGPAPYVKVEDVLGDGLQLLSNDIGLIPPGTPPGHYSWDYSGGIAAGQEKVVHLRAKVISCKNLFDQVTATWGCDGSGLTCQTPAPFAEASIKLILKEPSFIITPPSSITIPYCGDVAVSIPYSNTGSGAANNTYLQLQNMPNQYQITNLVVTNFPAASYDPVLHKITIGDIGAGVSGTITFNFGMKRSGACDASNGVISIIPSYTDQCGNPWFPPTTIMAYTLDLTKKPSLAVTKNGPGTLHLDETGTYSLGVTYNKGACNDPITANIVDTYPANFIPGSVDGGVVDSTMHTITWSGVSLASGIAWTKNIELKASANPCDCGSKTTNFVNVSAPDDCCGCPLSGGASKDIIVNCDSTGLFTSTKTATPNPQENCRDILYTTKYTFPQASQFTNGWADMYFKEEANNGQTLPTGVTTIQFKVSGGSDPSFSCTLPQAYTLGTEINLNFLNGCKPLEDNMVLEVSYTLHQNNIGSFVDWSDLRIVGHSASCSGDPSFHEGVLVNVGKSDFSIDMTYPNKMDSCGTYTFNINLHQNGPYHGYDMQITYDDTDFAYIPGSSSISGINNGGTPIPSTPFEPTRGIAPNDHILTWNLHTDVNCPGSDQTGTISFQVQKTCPQEKTIRATLDYKDYCGVQQPQGTFNGAPLLLDKANLVVLKTPEVIFATQKRVAWRVYVVNSGSGTAYGVSVVDTLGTGLTYAPGTGKVDNVPQEPAVSGQVLTWTFSPSPDMATYALHNIDFEADITGCADLVNNVNAKWGCLGGDCQIVPGSSIVEQVHTTLQTIRHTAPKLDPCGDQSDYFEIQVQNAGDAYAYQVSINEHLPGGVVIVPGTEDYGSGPVPTTDYSNLNNPKWSYSSPWAPGTTATIKFKAKVTDCAFASASNPVATAQANFELPCGTPLQSAESPVQVTKFNPHLNIIKEPVTIRKNNNDPITWTITVTNTGDYTAKNVIVRDTLPANVAYDSSSPIPTTISPLVVWNLPDIPVGGSSIITLNAHVASCTDDTLNQAVVEWGCCDPKETSSSSATLVTQPNIALSLSPTPINTCGGTRTITIVNTGTVANAPNSGSELTYTLPTGFVFKTGSATITGTSTHSPALDPVPTDNGATLVWTKSNIDLVNSDETITITFDLVSAPGQCGVATPSSESVTYNYFSSCGPLTATQSQSISSTIAALEANIVPLVQHVSPDGSVSWKIYVNNTGAADATDVTITDVKGSDFNNVAVSSPDLPAGLLAGNTITWNIPVILSHDSWSRVITAKIFGTGDQLTNHLTAIGTCHDTACVYSQSSKDAIVSRLTKVTKKVTDTEPTGGWTTSNYDSLPNTPETIDGTTIYYAIKFSNPSLIPAADVVMTDQLPSDLAGLISPSDVKVLDGSTGLTYSLPAIITISGDTIYIEFGTFPANTIAIVVITANVPQKTAPATWYNTVNVVSKDDPPGLDNTDTVRIYIRPSSYVYIDAAKSFDDLLGSQQDLLFSFEDLLHKYIDSGLAPEDSAATYEFVTSFEQLLREQSKIESSLVDLLNNHEATGWASTDPAVQNELLTRYEENIRKEAYLLSSFEFAIKQAISKYWTDPNVKYDTHTLTIRQELSASFEDLLKRQVTMLREFGNLEQNLVTTDPVVKTKFLASFEDLLRLQANLLLSFEDVTKLAFPTGDNTNPPGPVPPYMPMAPQNVTQPVASQNVTQPTALDV